jgi:hypothetical protein
MITCNVRLSLALWAAVPILSACGGGGGGGGGGVSVAPFVSYSQIGTNTQVSVENGISNEIDYTYNVGALTATSLTNSQTGQSGAKVVVSYDASSNLGTATLTTAGGTAISWNSATDTFGTLNINNNVEAAISANGQDYTLIANPFNFGWDYQTFGTWLTGAGTGSGKAGNYSIGSPTTGASIPTTGTATYTGATGGRYVTAAGLDYFVSSNLSATANYATRSVALTSTSSVASRDLISQSSMNAINFTGTMTYAAATNVLTGTITTTGGMNGTAKGQFYGPSANELGGSFTAAGGGLELLSGAFGAKK